MFPPCWKEHQIDVRIAMTIIYPVAEHHGTSYTHRKSNIDTKCDGFLRLYLLSNVFFFWYPFFSFRSDRRGNPRYPSIRWTVITSSSAWLQLLRFLFHPDCRRFGADTVPLENVTLLVIMIIIGIIVIMVIGTKIIIMMILIYLHFIYIHSIFLVISDQTSYNDRFWAHVVVVFWFPVACQKQSWPERPDHWTTMPGCVEACTECQERCCRT